MAEKVKDLIEQRDDQYGSAWIECTHLIGAIPKGVWHRFQSIAPQYLYAWIIILNKMYRILVDPYHKDSWRDIAGYATLVLNDLEAQEKEAETKAIQEVADQWITK